MKWRTMRFNLQIVYCTFPDLVQTLSKLGFDYKLERF